MFAILTRGAFMASVVVLGLATWLVSNSPTSLKAGTVPFSKILDDLRHASTLELTLLKSGSESQILVRAPGLVRKEESATRYQIAAGSRLWQVDEAANTVEERDSPWFLSPASQIDLLGLLDLGVIDASALLRSKPIDRAEFPEHLIGNVGPEEKRSEKTRKDASQDGKASCLVYRADLPTQEGRVRIEAFVDPADQRLKGIFAWPVAAERHAGPPLAEMRLIAINEKVDDNKFEIASSLTEDGRIGSVSHSQGIVVLRPKLSKRWSPIGPQTILKTGDWLRTELRGANAAKVVLTSDVELVVGPGALLELISPTKARLHSGMVQIVNDRKLARAPNEAPQPSDPAPQISKNPVDFTLLGPGEQTRVLKETDKQLIRVDRDERLVSVEQKPVWLSGFEGATSNESIGSLIVNLPDGRNEPLTVGYHKVTVEIRDQIARTTIEESFVNRTRARLEGVFHFPLPADASISGFGMWIGNDLVEADIVEKQRAREIYETILRERRDPGLLEWTSGNLFKARVFPIEPESEKRVKIVYTQVLPLRGNQYRYSYALRSDLLRMNPLRELSLSVTVNSALALKSVSCPTHSTRTQLAGHSAQVEFSAQEYSPTRDFEVVCEIDHKQSDVVVIPHRRGDDGYFLLQITPPDQGGELSALASGSRLNQLIPDGKPLNLMFLCDTSGSMDSEKRTQQAEFVSTVLASLGPDDRFQLVACDVGTAWLNQDPQTASPENVAAAAKFLTDRISLGWTNLDRAFDDVLEKAAAGSHIIYLGDGIISSGDTDPAAFVKRLGNRIRRPVDAALPNADQSLSAPRVTLHSVSVGNTFDAVALKGIASAGKGSLRSISGSQSPQIVARELLNEIARPGLKDVHVEFHGLKTAAVYPPSLPDLPAGTQQIIVGRYLPEEGHGDLNGEVIVTGIRGNEKVRFAARISLKNAEEGNSFIPRLWARSHLDHLLEQGRSSLIQDEVIRLSEEFHIITPFTSLLVLESDADRERFGVRRRYEMRDGERFFADGRSQANFELLQQQVKQAGDWRIGLRRQILQSLATQGRNSQQLQQQFQQLRNITRGLSDRGSISRFAGGFGGGLPRGGANVSSFEDEMDAFGVVSDGRSRGAEGDFKRMAWLGDVDPESGLEQRMGRLVVGLEASDKNGPIDALDGDFDEPVSLGMKLSKQESRFEDLTPLAAGKPKQNLSLYDFETLDWSYSDNGGAGLRSHTLRGGLSGGYAVNFDSAFAYEPEGPVTLLDGTSRLYGSPRPDYLSWVNTLFPALDPPPRLQPTSTKAPENWTAEAVALSKSLLRLDSLLQSTGGIELQRQTQTFDPRWQRSLGRNQETILYSPDRWLTRGMNVTEQTVVNYCNDKDRGAFSLGFLLGRTRPAVPADLKSPPLALFYFSPLPLHQVYAQYSARVESAKDDRVTLILTMKKSTSEIRYTIDTARHVVLSVTTLADGKVASTTSYDNFVELAGTWWATRVVATDEQNRILSETRMEVTPLPKQAFAERMSAEMAVSTSVQFLKLPVPSLKVSRQRVTEGADTFTDRMVMILDAAQRQQWDEMWKHVDVVEKDSVDKPGLRWIRTILLATIRRNEEAMKHLTDEAQRLIPHVSQDEVFLAEFILNRMASLASVDEVSKVHQLLKAVYDRSFAERLPQLRVLPGSDPAVVQQANAEIQRQIKQMWLDRETSSLESRGRSELSLELRKTAAEEMYWDHTRQEYYAQRLVAAGRVEEAHAWLRRALQRPELNTYESDSLRNTVADIYRQKGQWDLLLKWTSEWIAAIPDSTSSTPAFSQHFSAMILNEQLEGAYALADQWLKDARVPGTMSPVQRARLDAAISFADGYLPQLNFQRMDPRWFEPLAETARFFVRHSHHFDIVQRCVSNHYFSQTDTSDELRGEWLAMLQTELDTLSPIQISTLVGWTLSGRLQLMEPINGRRQMDASEVPADIWDRIVKSLKQRWANTNEVDDKWTLSEAVRTIYVTRFAETQLLPFLRERVSTVDPAHKSPALSALFNVLLSTKWTADIEREAFEVWRRQSADFRSQERLPHELATLMRLVDVMLANRIAAGERDLTDHGELDKLTRQELASRKLDIRRVARRGLAERLVMQLQEIDQDNLHNEQLTPAQRLLVTNGIKLERAWLDVQDEHELKLVEADCWSLLGEVPPRPLHREADSVESPQDDEAVEASQREAQLTQFDGILRHRALVTLMFLATRLQADPAATQRLLSYVDAGLATENRNASEDEQLQLDEFRNGWRKIKFRLLVALDRPDDLEKELRDWIRLDAKTGPWRQALARLVAERGKLDEAITLLESCEREGLLRADDYRLLANWYLALNQRDAYERNRVLAYMQTPERQLAQNVYQIQNRWNQSNTRLPSELDENTVFLFQALFKKSGAPENYLWQLRTVYAASRDFRLLHMVPDAVLGRSPQQIYAYLQALQSNLLDEVRNESTADEILKRVRELRAGERTTTDQRALDLFEAIVERRFSDMQNQPGPHTDACVVALQRAFQRDWSDGERLLMAQLLFSLGGVNSEPLQKEQLREFRELQKSTAAGSREHLVITSQLCQVLFWNYAERKGLSNNVTRDGVVHEMEAEIRNYLEKQGGVWPHADNAYLDWYVAMLESLGRYAAAETVLQQRLARPEHAEQSRWLNERLLAVYKLALEHDGSVSLGTGRLALFPAIVERMLKDLDIATDDNARFTLIERLSSIFEIAGRHKLPDTAARLKEFAFQMMPKLLRQQRTRYRESAGVVLPPVAANLSPTECLRYVVERMEQWPQWLKVQYDNEWSAFGSELAARRQAAGSTGLDDRVFKLAVDRLQRDLRQADGGHQAIFHVGYQYFWKEKSEDFAKAAEEVLNERRASGRRALVVANYLRNGLQLMPRSIEILLIAHSKGQLDESSLYQLVLWLHQANRYGEGIPILEELVKDHPDNINYRTELMVAFANTQRFEQLQDLIKSTDQHFHQAGRWTEGNIVQFARGCQGALQWERAHALFTEAIALHQRSHPGSGLNDNTLSDYYQQLARVESRLSHTRAAVTAASAAIICWGPQHQHRQYALNTLREVLGSATDLPAYVEHLDAEAARTGQDSPILRKALGDTFRTRNELAKAVAQYKVALELQPNDKEIHQSLIACYDAMNDSPAATSQLLKLIDLQRHDLTLFRQLADRLKSNEAEAERAATSIVESAPNESESHAELAELRQQQNRWDEAIPHWQQVAELRKREPTGLLKLAEAQIHEKRWDEANVSLQQLLKTEWPSRFNNLTHQIQQLQQLLPRN